MLEALKEAVCQANLQLPKHGLVTFTWGNVSGIDRAAGMLVINGSFGGLITGDDSVGVSETLPTIIVGETGVNKALSLTMKEGIYLNGNGYVFNATYIDPETGKDKVLVAMAGDKTLEYALPGQTMQFTYENGIWSK